MEQTVWGDLLFFVNFCMDFEGLFLTAKLLHKPFSLWRAALFSAFGAVYAVAALFFSTTGAMAFFLDLLVCYLMCLGTFFQKGKGRGVVLPFLFYFGVSFAVGGVMSGMASLLSHIELPLGSASGGVSTGTFFLLAAVGGVTTFLWGRITRSKRGARHADTTIEMAGKRVVVRGLVDTGNLMSDPLSARPVAILSERVAQRLFSPSLFALLQTGDTKGLATLPVKEAKRVRLLPTTTVTGEKMLAAVLPDLVTVDFGKGQERVDVLVAVAPVKVGFDECEVLLPAALR